jgi:phosphate-selective porin OprO/OprP
MKKLYLPVMAPVVAIISLGTAPSARAELSADVFGRLQVDMNQYSSDITELGSGSELRRARIGVQGDLANDWFYKIEYDFADQKLQDAYARHGIFTIGQFKPAQSLEIMTSDKYLTFIERPAIGYLTLARRLGIGATVKGENWTAAATGFGQDSDVKEMGLAEGMGFSGRVTYLPWTTDKGQLHLGAWGSWEQPQSTTTETVRIRAYPESHVTGIRLVDTGSIENVDNVVKMGLEISLLVRSVSVQGEYIRADVNRSAPDSLTPTPNFSFDGYYVQASYMTGGNTRNYKDGYYGRTMATNAWEFAVRYSTIDLTGGSDGALLPGKGGQQNVLTLGVNYYINPNMRVMLNYLDIEANSYNDATPDENPSAINMRFALDF